MPYPKAQRFRMGAYVLLVFLVVVGFFQLQRQQITLKEQTTLIEMNRVKTSKEICTRVEKLVDVIEVIIDESTKSPPGDTAEMIARRTAFRNFAREQFRPVVCSNVVKKTKEI